MDFVIANTDNSFFKIEHELDEQIGALPLPFAGMDKSLSAVCTFFNSGNINLFFQCLHHFLKFNIFTL
jgi:cleavage and polyadenylation specificity factor subunit 4